MKPLRVLICSPMDLLHTKGTRLRALNMSRALADVGVDTHVVAYSFPSSFLSSSLHFYRLPRRKKSLYGGFLHQVLALMNIAKRVKPDIIYAQTQWGMFPSIVVGKLLGIPVVTDLHSPYLEDFRVLRGYTEASIKYLFRKKQEDLFISACAALTTVSSPLAELYSRKYKGKPDRKDNKKNKKIFVVRSGIYPDMFLQATGLAEDIESIKNDRLVVTYIGNFNSYQGLDLLLEAIPKVLKEDKNFLFLFIGGERHLLEPKINNIPPQNLHFIKHVDHSKVPLYMNSSDILVIPRPYTPIAHYAFPYKLVEYMASGKAIIATDISDHSAFIKDGETGILIEPSADALASSILKLRDSHLRANLGKNAREFVFENYNWSVVGEQLKSLLSEFSKYRSKG